MHTRDNRQVLKEFQETNINGVKKACDLFSGHQIMVLHAGNNYSKKELETEIVKNGGRRVQNCTIDTTIVLSDRNSFRCEAIYKQYGISILSVEWFMESVK
jgi:BRCA1 C Terminus (BRCT) domain